MSPEEKQIVNLLKEARTNYLNDNFKSAIEIYEELSNMLKDDPANLPVIHIELGWSYYYDHNYLKAIELFQNILENDQTDLQQKFDALRLIGFSYQMLGDLTQARKYLEKALAQDVDDNIKRFTFFELGKIIFTKGQIDEAEHYINIANALFSPEEENYKSAIAYYLGFIKYFQKKFSEARGHFDFILRRSTDPKIRAGGFFGVAHLHYQYKDYQALIDICEKILRTDNTFFDKETLGYFMSEAYLHLKRMTELEMFFTELQKNYPHGRYVAEYPKFQKELKKWKESHHNNKNSENN